MRSVLRYRVLFYYLVVKKSLTVVSPPGNNDIPGNIAGMIPAKGKTEIRGKLLAKRRALDRRFLDEASATIRGRAENLPALVEAIRVHCYVSMEHDREVCTLGLLESLVNERKAVFMPYIEHGLMRSVQYLPGHCFRTSKSGPPVPEPLILSPEERFDAVIVPLIGFDRKGGRIGYGKGWYDRFFERLSQSGNNPVRIGLAFAFQEVVSVPSDSWDQPLDFVVTENEIVNCLNSSL